MKLQITENLSFFFEKCIISSEYLSHFFHNGLHTLDFLALHLVQHAAQLGAGNGCIGVAVVHNYLSDLGRVQAALLAEEAQNVALADLVLLALTYL